jgi:Co/Zn/Cd efflux system component
MKCGPETSERRNLDSRLWISAALNITITLVELAGCFLAGSLALLADAMHNFADAGALGVANCICLPASKPPEIGSLKILLNKRYGFGYRRVG